MVLGVRAQTGVPKHTHAHAQSRTQTHTTYELAAHLQGAKRGFTANFPAQKRLVKVKPLLLPHLKGSFKTPEGVFIE